MFKNLSIDAYILGLKATFKALNYLFGKNGSLDIALIEFSKKLLVDLMRITSFVILYLIFKYFAVSRS